MSPQDKPEKSVRQSISLNLLFFVTIIFSGCKSPWKLTGIPSDK